MKKSSLTRALFVAGAVAMAGAAQADAIFYPDGTVVELGDSDSMTESVAMDESSSIDTTVLGAPSANLSTTTTTTVPVHNFVYVQPNIDFDRATVVSQMHHRNLVLGNKHTMIEKQSASTFNVPSRAGEASTMTGGAPNMVTDNNTFVVGGTSIPHSAITVGQPYYVMSW